MKNSMIKGGIGNYLKSGTFFLNIVDFPFTLCLNNIFYCITYLLPFDFTVLSVLDNTFMYDTMDVSQICRKWNLLIRLNSIFYRIRLCSSSVW